MSIKGGSWQEGERGPGWYDVNSFVRALENQYEKELLITVSMSGLKGPHWGLRVTAWFEGKTEVYGCGSYGPAHPGNGQKTMAAAFYHALLQLDIAASSAWVAELKASQEISQTSCLDDVFPPEG